MRDDFTAATKRLLESRVASVCCKPGCGRVTRGAHSKASLSINIGEAGHITAAAPGGARFDESLTPEMRRLPGNGIWLCNTCHTIVDSDESPFSETELRRWKSEAETRARAAIELSQKRMALPPFASLLHTSMGHIPAGSLERFAPPLMQNAHEVVADIRAPFVGADVEHEQAVRAQLAARDELCALVDAQPEVELAYYGIAHIPLAIHMGFLLGTRMSAHYAERDRDANRWAWLSNTTTDFPKLEEHAPDLGDAADVAIAVSVSYPIREEQLRASVGAMPVVRLSVEAPALDIIKGHSQVEAYSKQFRAALERVSASPSVRRVHLFAATPMCISFALGRQIRSTVHPDVFAYNFNRSHVRPYGWRLLMTDDPVRAKLEGPWQTPQ